MRTNVLIKDHPYTAVTDATGRFEIKDLPTGEQTFRVWHERPGYVVREWKVTIAAGSLRSMIRSSDMAPPSPAWRNRR